MAGRVPIEQTFSMGSLGVTNASQPITGIDINNLTEAFMISNPTSNVNSVFLGDSSVNTSNGIEIPPGSAPLFSIIETRQLYELQNALIRLYELIKCDSYPGPSDLIPLVVWNPSHFFLVASVPGPTTVGMIFFRNVYV
jgi:hypothetical protein